LAYSEGSGKAILTILITVFLAVAVYNWRFSLFFLHMLVDLLYLNLPPVVHDFIYKHFIAPPHKP
jgi:hypothetical protein